jgi:hypothetical protein
MGLSGEIKTMPVTDLLQWIETTRKSGILEYRSENHWKKIFFQKGQVVFASSSTESEKLGQYLVRKHLIGDSELFKCLEENERSGKKLTQILEDRNLISHEELYKEVVLLIKEILFDLFLWQEGIFRFKDMELPSALVSPLALKTGQILFEVLSKIDEGRRGGEIQSPPPEALKDVDTQTKVRGRIVFKVDDKKFNLPGAYRKTELTSFVKEEKEEDPV